MVLKEIYKKFDEVQQQNRFYKQRKPLSANKFVFLCMMGSFIGYNWGKHRSNREDNEQYLTTFQHEDQLYNILDQEKKPLFLFYYIPGDKFGIRFREHFVKSAKVYHEKVSFIMINAAEHYNHAKNQQWDRIPKIELMKKVEPQNQEQMQPPIQQMNQDQLQQQQQQQQQMYEVIKYDNDFSMVGIQAFMEEQQIVERQLPANVLKKFTQNLYNKLY